MRSLSPVEAALLVAVGGSVLAVGVPAFVRNLHASRLTEPIEGLNRIAKAAATFAQSRKDAFGYPPSVGPTPASVPLGVSEEDPPGAWDQPTWRALDFRFTEPHRYSFEFQSTERAGRAEYVATARGDLDGDGELSQFSIRGEMPAAGPPRTFPLEMLREIE